MVVHIQKVSYAFNNSTVLDNISLTVPAKTIYGFVGQNGAGKTTTLRLLIGLLSCKQGAIRVFGKDLTANRIPILRKTGVLLEQPAVYQHLTGNENLELSALMYSCSKQRIKEVLKIVGLSGKATEKVKNYSLGMKQRLGIACALLHDPELLILDEPLNGLDPGGIIEIRNLLLDLNRQHNKTILISSHILSELEKVATRVGLIHKGKIIYEGPVPEGESLEEIFIQKTTT